MKELQGKVAVVTGGASGIGFALAKKALALGMNVAIADVEAEALQQASTALGAPEQLLAVVTDVSSAASMEALSEAVLQRFGAVHVLFNNAGVSGGGAVWEQTEEDWDWVLGVNLRGVTNGVRIFTPGMIAQGEGHIVNTASIAGLVSAQGTSTYTVSKHAVVALSEVLHGDLRDAGASVGVSVLCPSYVNTNIYKFDHNRRPGAAALSPEQKKEEQAVEEMIGDFFRTALSPDVVAEQVFAAIAADQFYILTHPKGSMARIEDRLRAVLDGSKPAEIGAADYPAE